MAVIFAKANPMPKSKDKVTAKVSAKAKLRFNAKAWVKPFTH